MIVGASLLVDVIILVKGQIVLITGLFRHVDEKLEQSTNILNQLNEAIYFGVNLIINLDVSTLVYTSGSAPSLKGLCPKR